MAAMTAGTGAGGRIARWSDGPIVGRDALLAELVDAVDAAAQGEGAIVLLRGEAGIGKTTVARIVAKAARDRLAVSWGTCTPDGSAPAFWPWRPIVAVDASPLGDTDPTPGAGRLEQLTSLRDRVRAVALEHPRLHVIEDLQWADVASVLLLEHVGVVAADLPLLVLATLRTGEPQSPQLHDALAAVARTSRTRNLPVLDHADIAELVRAADVDADAQLVGLVHARTGGNPLFVTELLRALPPAVSRVDRLEAATGSVPERVSDLVVDRIGRLPTAVSDVLATAAVIGVEGAVTTLAAIHGTDVESTLDLLEQARAAHVLDAAPAGRWRFRHQLIRDAVYETMTAKERPRRHARVVAALESDPSTAASTLAHHALAATPLIDAGRAVALAARAGDLSMAQHAYEEAVVWFARALDAAPHDASPRSKADLCLRHGEASRHIGDIETARRSFVAAAGLSDEPDVLARAALGHADPGADLGIAYRTVDPVTVPLLERALAAQPDADSIVVVHLEARLAAQLYFSDDPARARELSRHAVDRAHRIGDPGALVMATALAHDAFVVGQADLGVQLAGSSQLAAWSQQLPSVAASLTAHRARVFDLLAAGDLAGVDAEILAFTRLAEPLRTPGYLWWPSLWSAMRALLEGRHDVAEQRAVEAYETGATAFPTLAFLNLSFLLFFLRREQGRLGEMEQATRDYSASQADIPALRVAVTFLLAETGRTDEARETLAGFDEGALATLHDRNWPASWFQLARAASIVGDRDTAARLLEPRHRPSERCVQVSLGTVCLGATDLAAAWLLHAVGDLDGADERYRTAAALNARIGARSWLAQTRYDHARLLLARGDDGDREAAAELAALARAAASEIGLAPVLANELVPTEAAAVASFRRDGAVWTILFAGRSVQLPDARGMRDLGTLLSRPGESVSVLELDSGTVGARGAPALDDRTRAQIRGRLREFDAAEADAEAAGDGERAAVVREQRQTLAEAVARDYGLGGRPRLVGDPVERARKTVSTRIRRTIAAIAKAHPDLGRHLDRSIDTGSWCAYRPAERVDWQT